MQINIEITGEVVKISPVQSIGQKGFQKQDLALHVADAEYPYYIACEVHGKSCEQFAAVKPGDTVTVSANLTGREWFSPQGERKFFNTVKVWKLAEHIPGENPADTMYATPYNDPRAPIAQRMDGLPDSGLSEDDLPF